METTNPTRPMTASEYFDYRHSTEKFPFNGNQLLFAEAYAAYRLQFEREQQQNNEWMPTDWEWQWFPEVKWAAMDHDGFVHYFTHEPYLDNQGKFWLGKWIFGFKKDIDDTKIDWTKCKVARPEGV